DIKSGKLGEIYAVEAQMNCIHSVEKRNWLGNYPGGMLYYLGCHLIDLVYSFCGEPNEVIPLSQPIGTDGVTADDFGMAVFKYKNGVSFVKSTAVEIGGFERRQLVVCGTKGTVELKPFEWLGGECAGVFSPQTTGVREAFDENWHAKGEYHDTAVHGRYDAMFRAFADYVTGEKKNPFGYEYERELHKLILKACRKDSVK
ncbi:MAG: Gfo/Idh/MocA family oxidoreductase, partial [Acutalibacteraceae bacterium]|nr:Gfo/Idh/MocA family oxidoreductase [Acutalibacteraceae bacterium]